MAENEPPEEELDIVEAQPPEPEEPVDCGVWPQIEPGPVNAAVVASIQEKELRLAEEAAQDVVDSPPPDVQEGVDTYQTFAEPLDMEGPLFETGVMSTGVRARSAAIWTRVVRDGARVRVRYRRGPECAERTTDFVDVDPEAAYTAVMALEGLRPASRYRYVVEAEGWGESEPGYFKTAPVEDVPVRMAFSADIHLEPEGLVLMDELIEKQPELYLSLGDWPYQDARPVSVMFEEYRWKMKETREHMAVHHMMRAMPVEGIWDDHEVLNDWDAQDLVDEPDKVRWGIQSWREFWPTIGAREGETYRRFQWGPEIDIFMLDGRLHRAENASPDTLEKTMLGEAQLAWLLEGLSSSTSAFKLVVTSVPLVHATTRDDSWDGFKHEREKIANHIVEQQIPGVVFLTADQHWLAVHHLPEGPKEFQVGPFGFFLRTPREGGPPWVVLQNAELNFGVLDYTPRDEEAGRPATLTFQGLGDLGEVLYEEVIPEGVGELKVRTSWKLMGWTLSGAHVFSGIGNETIRWATPGEYEITWRPLLDAVEAPKAKTKTLASGGSEKFRDTTEGPQPVFLETFNRTLLNRDPEDPRWVVVDEGKHKAPSRWRIQGDALREYSDLRDDAIKRHLIERRGTFVWTEDFTFEPGQTLYMDVFMGDDDGFGVMYGIQDAKNYYRVDFDGARSGVRLVKVEKGVFTELETEMNWVPGKAMESWQRLEITWTGESHVVRFAGKRVLRATDATFSGGGIGLFAWGMKDIRFDNIFALAKESPE